MRREINRCSTACQQSSKTAVQRWREEKFWPFLRGLLYRSDLSYRFLRWSGWFESSPTISLRLVKAKERNDQSWEWIDCQLSDLLWRWISDSRQRSSTGTCFWEEKIVSASFGEIHPSLELPVFHLIMQFRWVVHEEVLEETKDRTSEFLIDRQINSEKEWNVDLEVCRCSIGTHIEWHQSCLEVPHRCVDDQQLSLTGVSLIFRASPESLWKKGYNQQRLMPFRDRLMKNLIPRITQGIYRWQEFLGDWFEGRFFITARFLSTSFSFQIWRLDPKSQEGKGMLEVPWLLVELREWAIRESTVNLSFLSTHSPLVVLKGKE